MRKKHYRTVFISDIHLGNLKNQGDKLIKFLDSISFENLIIIGDFIDYWQLKRFGKRRENDQATLNYINNLSKIGINITYIQGNHDRELKCSKEIKIENMTICREIYYQTLKGKTYFITHGDCMDGINKDGNKIGEIGSIMSGILQRIEHLWNKNVYSNSYFSLAEKLEEWIKKNRMPESKINKLITNFSKNINCEGLILGHFHLSRNYKVNGLDYFNTGDRLKNCSAVLENLKGDLKLVKY